MSKGQQSKAATPVAAEQSVAAEPSLRAKRVAMVQTTLVQRRAAAKQAAYAARKQAYEAEQAARAKQQQFQLKVAELAAEFGIPAVQVAPRANSATVQPSNSAILIEGQYLTPCKAVHAIAAKHRNRKATLAECKALGINPATAATQWGVFKKQEGL